MGTITRSFANLITASGPSAVANGSITAADLASGVSVNTPAFFVKRGSAGNTLTLNTNTALIFDSEEFDTDGAYNTVTGKFIVPSGQAGKYFFLSNVVMASSFCKFTVFIFKNGSQVIRGGSVDVASTLSASGLIDCSVGDEIEIFVNSAVSQDVTTATNFQGFKLI